MASSDPHPAALFGIPLLHAAFFVAIMASVLSLGMGLAHAYAFPNKITMSREAYLTAQGIYAGWFQIWIMLLIQLVSLGGLMFLTHGNPPMFLSVLIALAALIGAQLLFWMFTFPANKATQNWTVIPDNWEELRRSWEYSHFAGAMLQLVTVGGLVVGLLTALPATQTSDSAQQTHHQLRQV